MPGMVLLHGKGSGSMSLLWRTVKCILVSSSFLLTPCVGLYEDQVGMIDWHQQYLGRVHLAAFQTSTQRKRVFVATEANVVAALHLRTGEIAWRHVLGADDRVAALEVSGTHLFSLSSAGPILRAWRVADGTLLWDAPLAPTTAPWGHVSLDLLLLPAGSEKGAPPDVVVLAGGEARRVAALDGSIVWSTAVAGSRLYLAPSGQLYAVGLSDTKGGSSTGVLITELDPATGAATVVSGAALAATPSAGNLVVVTGGVLVALDDSGSHVLAAQITSRGGGGGTELHRHPLAGLLGEEGASSGWAALLPSRAAAGLLSLVVGGKVAVLQVAPTADSLELLRTYKAPAAVSDGLDMGGSEAGGSGGSGGAIAVLHRVGLEVDRKLSLEVLGTGYGEPLGAGDIVQVAPHRGGSARVFLNAYPRKTGGPGFRAVVVSADDSLSLFQQGEVVWAREEALASIVDTRFVDLPVGRDAEQSLKDWFKAHWMRAKDTLMLATPEERAAVQALRLNSAEKTGMTRDHNGFRKLLVVLTRPGKILALHSGDGRIVWSLLVPALASPEGDGPPGGAGAAAAPQPLKLLLWQDPHRRGAAVRASAPEILALGRAAGSAAGGAPGVVAWVNAHTGAEVRSARLGFPVQLTVQLPLSDSLERRLLLLVEGGQAAQPPRARLLPSTQEAMQLLEAHKGELYLHVVDEAGGAITGYAVGAPAGGGGGGGGEVGAGEEEEAAGLAFELVEIWKVAFPLGTERIAAVAARRSDDVVQSRVKVLPDRSVAYKYVTKNLLFVATAPPPPPPPGPAAASPPPAPEDARLVAYVIDVVSGKILHRRTHAGMRGPVHAVFAENWVVYHYLNARSHRYEMSVMELLDDSPGVMAADIAKYALQLGSANLTAPASAWCPPKMAVQAQSYFFTYSAKCLAATTSTNGITDKELLIGTVGDQVYTLPKRFFDPRRTPNPSQMEQMDGIVPYTDSLPLMSQGYLTHKYQVAGLRSIVTEPSSLESTSLIFVYGIDLYFTRRAPSRMYDSLSEDFSYLLLLLTIAALLVAILVTWILSEYRDLQYRWK